MGHTHGLTELGGIGEVVGGGGLDVGCGVLPAAAGGRVDCEVVG